MSDSRLPYIRGMNLLASRRRDGSRPDAQVTPAASVTPVLCEWDAVSLYRSVQFLLFAVLTRWCNRPWKSTVRIQSSSSDMSRLRHWRGEESRRGLQDGRAVETESRASAAQEQEIRPFAVARIIGQCSSPAWSFRLRRPLLVVVLFVRRAGSASGVGEECVCAVGCRCVVVCRLIGCIGACDVAGRLLSMWLGCTGGSDPREMCTSSI